MTDSLLFLRYLALSHRMTREQAVTAVTLLAAIAQAATKDRDGNPAPRAAELHLPRDVINEACDWWEAVQKNG